VISLDKKLPEQDASEVFFICVGSWEQSALDAHFSEFIRAELSADDACTGNDYDQDGTCSGKYDHGHLLVGYLYYLTQNCPFRSSISR